MTNVYQFYLVLVCFYVLLSLVYSPCRSERVSSMAVRITSFDGHTCRAADVVISQDNIRSGFECMTHCVDNANCSCLFYKPGYCRGCSSCHTHGTLPGYDGTSYYYLSPDLSQYDLHHFNGHVYKFSNERLNWDDAQTFCQDLGSNLVEIYSAEEHDWIITHLTEGQYWTGGRRNTTSDTFLWWETGQMMTYERWASGQPSGTDCMSLWQWRDYEFDDAPCTNAKYFICKSV